MRSFRAATLYPLTSCRRSRFFWIWNSIALLITFVISNITYFEFESQGELAVEFFLSTIVLAGSVNSIAFQIIVTGRQRDRGDWRIVFAGPTAPLTVVSGLAMALVAIQLIWVLLAATAFRTSIGLLDRAVPSGFAAHLVVLFISLSCLSVFHVLVGCLLQRTWALLFMIASYFVAQVSNLLYRNVSPSWHLCLDVLYTVVPDLRPLGSGGLTPSTTTLLTLAGQATLYVATVLFLASLGLARWSVVRHRS